MYEEKSSKFKKRKNQKENHNQPKKTYQKNYEKKKTNLIKEVLQHLKFKKRSYTKKTKNEYNTPTILIKIDYKLLLLKLFILFLVMIIITFTTARLKKHHEKQNEMINNNLNIIATATKKYYENNLLPINIGDSTSFILEEMKNLELIDEIKDENNKYCNYLDSYIIITKIENNTYRLKIYLKCPSKEKILDEILICQEKNCYTKK